MDIFYHFLTVENDRLSYSVYAYHIKMPDLLDLHGFIAMILISLDDLLVPNLWMLMMVGAGCLGLKF